MPSELFNGSEDPVFVQTGGSFHTSSQLLTPMCCTNIMMGMAAKQFDKAL